MHQLKINKSITNRSSAALDKYLSEIAKEPLLTVDEEVELAQRIHSGDKEALDKLVRSNLRFVVSVAKQYQNGELTLSDLVNEGNVGLIKAAEKFDETRGFKFISYAVWWIRQSIMQALAEQSRLVRLPLNQVGLLNKINKTIADFVQEHERQPSLHELARLVDVDESKIAETLSASSRGASLDAPFQDGEENSLISVLSDDSAPAADNGMDLESLSTDLEQILKELKPREIQVLKMSFGIGCNEKTLEEIADTLGLTRERVRQIREKSLKKLRDTAGADMLRKYLG